MNRRIAMAFELTAYLKRHTDTYAGAMRYAEQHRDWICVIDDFAEQSLRAKSKGAASYQGVVGRATSKLAEAAARARIPVVNVWRNSPAKDLFSVYPDFAKAGEMVANHLLDRGVRRLACVYRKRDPGEQEMVDRIATVAREAECPCKMIAVGLRFAHSASAWANTRQRIQTWLRDTAPPMGVFTSLDMLGRHVAQLAGENQLHVPNDVALVSAHNEPTICESPEPAITSLDYGFDRVGFEAARLMDALLNGNAPATLVTKVAPRELVVRQSSDFTYLTDDVADRAMQFMATRSQKSISVSDVARHVNVSRRTLESRFVRATGATLGHEIRRLRIEHAKRLLAGTQTPISRIARDVGFENAQQLARVFRRELGMTPTEYRSQRQI